MKKVIIDTDIGEDIDDIWALSLILSIDLFDVKMISLTQGDVEYKSKIVAKMLQILNREDIIIAKGISTNLSNAIYPQIRWIQDFKLEEYKGRIVDNYYGAYKEVLDKHNDCMVLALGPFTSLIQSIPLFRMYNTNIASMAGSIYKGYFNKNTIDPECNVVTDIVASKILFESGVNITLLPLDVCNNIIIDKEDYQQIKKSQNDFGRIVMENYRIWQEDYVGGAKKFDIEVSSSILYDLAPVFFALFPQNYDVLELPIYVDENGYTRIGGNYNINVATRVHKQDTMLEFACEQYSTKIEKKCDFKAIGIDGKFILIYTLRRCNALLSVLEVGWEAKRPGSHYGPTKRDYYILHFVTQGKGTYIVGNKKYELKAGDCFLVPPKLTTYYEADKEDPYVYYWIGFDGVEAKKLLERTNLIANNNYVIKPNNIDSIVNKLKALSSIKTSNGATEYLFLGSLYTIFADMFGESEEEVKDNKDYVDNAISFMNENYNKNITISDITKSIGIERTYFYRLFINKMGISPQEYLINLRLENAKLLLCNTKKSVKNIAYSVGYENYISFIKIFKDKLNVSPSEYRKKIIN